MSSTRSPPSLAIVALAIGCALTLAACPTPATPCNSDDDCSRRDVCSLGACVPASSEGEGEGASSEGEGASSEGEGASSEGEGEGASSEGEGASSEGEGGSGEGEGEGASTCGNTIVDPGEECDDGNTIDGDTCDSNCTFPRCGNGIVDVGEECDDGNTIEFDGCNTDCTASCYVGAGVGAEFVDDGGVCDALFFTGAQWLDALTDCRVRGGNLATVETPNESDAIIAASPSDNTWIGLNDLVVEGAMTWVDGSSSTFAPFANGEPNNENGAEDCVQVRRGDHAWNDDACATTYPYVCEFKTPSSCGDFFLDAGEECDDGNTRGGDGCSATCTQEPNFACFGGLCGKQVFAVPVNGTIDDAIVTTEPGALVTIAAGQYGIDNDIDHDLTFVGLGGTVLLVDGQSAPGGGVVHVRSGVTVQLAHVSISSTNGDAITVDSGAALTFVDGRAAGHNFGVRALNTSRVVIRRSTFTNCGSAALHFDTGDYDVADVLVHDNPRDGVELHQTALPTSRFAHATIADNASTGIDCSSNLIDASIVWNNGGGQSSGACAFVESDVEAASPVPGALNISVDPHFVDALGQNFHLTAVSPCIDAAPLSNEPRDIDSDVRSGVRDIGADEF